MDKILAAKITKVFGVRGEVKIVCYLEDPYKIEEYPLFDKDGKPIKLKISNKNKAVVGNSYEGAILIVKLDEVNDRNAAEKLRNFEIFVKREDFNNLDEDEFYYVDLIGLDVVDENKNKLGKVLNVMDYGAGGILEIEFENSDPSKNLEKVENFPFKDELFPEVKLKEGYITINLPEIIKEEEPK